MNKVNLLLQSHLRRIQRIFGYGKAIRHRRTGTLKVLIIGGYGYGNTGDEAQLGANLELWKTALPAARITVLSPNPAYTFSQHGAASEFASRIIFFDAHAHPHYSASDRVFRRRFWWVWIRMMLNGHLMRAGLSPIFASAEESTLLSLLHCADIMHVSGGGFLTGMTISRLWDSCLVMKICQILGTPYFLTGHTIGVFQSRTDRWLAKKALTNALTITLRDPGHSKEELVQLGISEDKLISSVDDALFCEKSPPDLTKQILLDNNIDPHKAYLCVNYHYWGMCENTKKKSAQRLAALLDNWVEKTHHQVLFVPMHSTDEAAEEAVIDAMQHPASLLRYPYDYRIARGAIAGAECLISFKHHPLIFALGEGVPAISISLDEYYWRKNDGAMRNFHQQDFCVHGDRFYQQETVDLLNNLLSNQSAIRMEIQSKKQAIFANRATLFNSIVKRFR